MKPYREENINVNVTPKLLRAIADQFEQAMEKVTVGDHVPFYQFYGDGFNVRLVADQEIFHMAKTGGIWK